MKKLLVIVFLWSFAQAQIYSPTRVTVPMRLFSSFALRPAIAPSGDNLGAAGLMSAQDKDNLDNLVVGGIGAVAAKVSYAELRAISGASAESVLLTNVNARLGNWYYVPGDVTTPDDSAMNVRTADGKLLRRYAQNNINATWFGADTAYEGNDYAALQRAIDWVIKYRTYGKLYIPAGYYKVWPGLLVLKDANNDGASEFVSLEIVGEKNAYDPGNTNGAETTIDAQDSTDFAIGIQRGKGVSISNINFYGWNQVLNTITTEDVGDSSYHFVIGHCRTNTQSPYAAVVIDPFCLNTMAMGNRYPRRTALYTEVSTGGSSDIRVINCTVNGFVVGIMNSPTGVTQNGEAHIFSSIWGYNCKSFIANGESQNRTVRLDHITVWGGVEVVFDCRRYGNHIGSAFIIDNVNIAGPNRWLIVPASFGIGGHNRITNIHMETLYGIGGNIIDSTIDNSVVELEGGQIDWAGQNFGFNRSPILGWLGTLRLKDIYFGYYSQSDPTMMYIAANQVICDNRDGVPILTTRSNLSTVTEINSASNGIYKYYDYTSFGNANRLMRGAEIYKNHTGNDQIKSTYNGLSMNSYVTSNSLTCTAMNSDADSATFSVNAADTYKFCPGATIFLAGLPGPSGVVSTVDAGANVVTIRFARKEITTTTYSSATLYQVPVMGVVPNFSIGNITSGSNKITSVESELGASAYIVSRYYFNHPAFPAGTWVKEAAGDSVILSANATRSETGAFVSNEYEWNTEGFGGAYMAGGTAGFTGQTTWKEGDIIHNIYTRNNTAIDTSIYEWICLKSGIIGTSRAPVFKEIKH